MFEKFHDFKPIDAELLNLRQEFTQIYKEKIAGNQPVSQNTVLSSIMKQHYRN